ncbi:MAG: hypothetical protein ACYTBZ_29365 [Planctomycetota bacterium]|jgi:hypothetical protein
MRINSGVPENIADLGNTAAIIPKNHLNSGRERPRAGPGAPLAEMRRERRQKPEIIKIFLLLHP